MFGQHSTQRRRSGYISSGERYGWWNFGGGYKPEAVDLALVHLNHGIQLAPEDLSIHRGRLHVLKIASRYSEMATALDESCKVTKRKTGADDWIPYPAELLEDGQIKAALMLLDVLNRHYPNSHDVIGDMAAGYLILKQYDHALPFALRAVELAPTDPIDTWNLARLYDFSGKVDLAQLWYSKALPLQTNTQQKKDNNCYYAEFVNRQLHDYKRACKLQRDNCPSDERGACFPTGRKAK